jgi:hypothetical protein
LLHPHAFLEMRHQIRLQHLQRLLRTQALDLR